MKKIFIALLTIFVAASSVLLSSCEQKVRFIKFNDFVFGIGSKQISLNATLYGTNRNNLIKAKDEILNTLKSLNSELNTVDEDSVIYKFNNYGLDGQEFNPQTKFYVSEHVYHMLSLAKDLHENKDGKGAIEGLGNAFELFNPAVYPLMELWGLDAKNIKNIHFDLNRQRTIPSPAQINEVLPYINLNAVNIGKDNKGYFIQKTQKEIKIDFGAQAKGYGADLAVKICGKYRLKSAVIDIGGNVYVYKSKPMSDGASQKFTVGVKMPDLNATNNFCALLAEDTSLVTSGDYVRYFPYDILGEDEKVLRKIKYAHILNPKTGLPVNINRTEGDNTFEDFNDEHGLTSVTVIHKSSELSDIYATIVMLLGLENGIKFMENNGLSGILISHDKFYAVVGDNIERFDHALAKGFEDYRPYVLNGKTYSFKS
ncbi:MAG TPA: FAD:protein FMN transferase [Clostridia bacterium]